MTLPRNVFPDDPTNAPDIIAGEPIYFGIATIVAPNPGTGSYFLFDQPTPIATWTIDHTLGRFPSVTVIGSDGFAIITDVEYPSTTRVVLTFAQPTSGKALLV